MSETARTTQVPPKDEILHTLQRELPLLRDRFGVVRVALYGSFARGEPRPDSDVDLLVELAEPLGLKFIELAYYLEDRLGVKVDLATFKAFRQSGEKPYREGLITSIQRDLIDVEAPAAQAG